MRRRVYHDAARIMRPAAMEFPGLIVIDLIPGPNLSAGVAQIFEALGPRQPVTTVRVETPEGREQLCRVTGWDAEGPCPAYACRVREPGGAEALLLYGGEQGLRLIAEDLAEDWDLDSPNQWGVPYLFLEM